MWKERLTRLIALFFAVLFLYTGISKLMDYDGFREQLVSSPVLQPIASFTAWVLPFTEFIIAVLLFLPTTRLKGLYASLVLMLLFSAYIITLFAAEEELPCSCGGVLEQLTWQQHLLFNGSCIALLILAIVLSKRIHLHVSIHHKSLARTLPMIFLFFIAAGGCRPPGNQGKVTGQEGKPMPSFSLLSPDSSRIVSPSPNSITGPAVIFYFTTQCPHCRKQAKELKESMDRMKDIRFYFVSRSPLPRLHEFVTEYNLKGYDNILTGRDTAAIIAKYFNIKSVPFTAVYGKDLLLIKTYKGVVSAKEIINAASETTPDAAVRKKHFLPNARSLIHRQSSQ